MGKKIKIEIWSDIACPYCYIGKRKLEMALEQLPQDIEVELIWHSYELHPDLPKGNNGPVGEYPEIEKLANEVGLPFRMGKAVKTNTMDALRLVKLAHTKGLATQAEEVLFRGYFIEGEDVSDRRFLQKKGEEIGLSADEVGILLDADTFEQEVKSDTTYGDEVLKLEYIPFYLINDKVRIEGSLAVEDYLRALQSAVREEGTQLKSGRSCSADGVCSL